MSGSRQGHHRAARKSLAQAPRQGGGRNVRASPSQWATTSLGLLRPVIWHKGDLRLAEPRPGGRFSNKHHLHDTRMPPS